MQPALLYAWFDQFTGWFAEPAYQSVHWRCMVAVQCKLRAMRLVGISPTSIVTQKLPWAKPFEPDYQQYATPGIIISPWGQEAMLGGLNRLDDVGYPVLVSIIASDNQDLTTNLSKYLLWRERVARAFRNQSLGPAVPEVYTCRLEPLTIAVPESFLAGFWSSHLLLRFISREPRG